MTIENSPAYEKTRKNISRRYFLSRLTNFTATIFSGYVCHQVFNSYQDLNGSGNPEEFNSKLQRDRELSDKIEDSRDRFIRAKKRQMLDTSNEDNSDLVREIELAREDYQKAEEERSYLRQDKRIDRYYSIGAVRGLAAFVIGFFGVINYFRLSSNKTRDLDELNDVAIQEYNSGFRDGSYCEQQRTRETVNKEGGKIK